MTYTGRLRVATCISIWPNNAIVKTLPAGALGARTAALRASQGTPPPRCWLRRPRSRDLGDTARAACAQTLVGGAPLALAAAVLVPAADRWNTRCRVLVRPDGGNPHGNFTRELPASVIRSKAFHHRRTKGSTRRGMLLVRRGGLSTARRRGRGRQRIRGRHGARGRLRHRVDRHDRTRGSGRGQIRPVARVVRRPLAGLLFHRARPDAGGWAGTRHRAAVPLRDLRRR